MKRAVAVMCLLLGCDVSESTPPRAATPEVAPATAPAEPPPQASELSPKPPPAQPEQSPEAPTDEPPFSVVEVKPSAGPLAQQLRLHAKRASEQGQRVVLEMGAPWCPPCKRAKALLARPEVQAELPGVLLLRANSDLWQGELDALGFDAPVIPVYYRLGPDGRPAGPKVRGDQWKSHVQVRSRLLAFLQG